MVSSTRSVLRVAAEVPVGSLGVDELADGITGLAAVEAQLGALRLSLVAEADRRKVGAVAGRDRHRRVGRAVDRGEPGGDGPGGAARAAARERYDATREAFAAGAINQAQAKVIVAAAEQLPVGVTEAHRRAAEAGLVVKAVHGMAASRLRQAGRRMLEKATAEIAAEQARRLADEHEAAVLTDEERTRRGRRPGSPCGDNGNGTWSGRFVIPELHGQLLRGVLERLSSPRRLNRGTGPRGRARRHAGRCHRCQELSWTERWGWRSPSWSSTCPAATGRGGFARNAVCTLLVHLDRQHLLDGLASARLDTGAHVSAGEARRLACGAGDHPGGPRRRVRALDLGRERRLHTVAQRRALSVTHETCAAEGCERPFAWCDIHHPHPWADGGATDLDNGVPLCGFHHRRAHDSRFDLSAAASGEVRFTAARR